MRALRAKRPEGFRAAERRRLYKMDDDDHFARLLAEQGGTCAICGQKEAAINPRTGEPFGLAVDHNHDTGAIRGLLCMNHNRALGMFGDNPDILRAAIAYLEHHLAEPA